MSNSEHDRLELVLAECLHARDAGQPIDPDALVAAHPDLAEDLRSFFRNQEAIERLAEPIRQAAPNEAPTLAHVEQSPATQPTRVRYFGDYELLEEIARGGMGVVYKARQTTLKRIVALKMILSGQLAGQDDVKRFQAEAEAAAKLDHPNIVPIFEIGQHEGQHYFSMAYVEGHSLARKVVAGPLPPREAAQLIRKVAEAVAYAHIEGVVHRDLKPANVLLDKSGEPRVTDFGLAKRMPAESLATAAEDSAAQLTATGQILGTPSYMPPEQAAGKSDEVGPLADVYSLGAILYCLLTGRPPFQAASPLDTLMQVLEKDPVGVRQLDPKVSRDLETICLKCLEKEPRRRYGSAREFADDLGRYLNDEPVRARRIGPIRRSARWLRRHRRSTATAAAAAMGAVVLVIGLWAGRERYRQAQQGQLELTTKGPRVVAEILDENDKLVMPGFPAPTQNPVSLPAGESYRLRLSTSGLPSETWPLEIERRKAVHLELDVRVPWLWPPLEMKPSEQQAAVRFDDHDDLLVFDFGSIDPSGGYERRSLRRIDGRTGRDVWPNEIVFGPEHVPPGITGADHREWMDLVAISGQFELARKWILQPPPDVNGDGISDVVLASEVRPSLAAFSGKDGALLWWHRGKSAATLAEPYPQYEIGQPLSADVNRDGTNDVVICATHRTTTGLESGWIAAIHGGTGEELWNTDLGEHPFVSQRRYAEEPRPLLVTFAGARAVAVTVDRKVLVFDLEIGGRRGDPIDVGSTQFQPPIVVDVDRDGDSEMVLVREDLNAQGGAGASPQEGGIEVALLSLSKRAVVWKACAVTARRRREYETPGRDMRIVEDLDSDGTPELVVPHTEARSENSWREWSSVRVHDARTGEVRWQRKLTDHVPPILRFVTGPDLDGDGSRDVFVAWHVGGGEFLPFLNAAALSGRDGGMFWMWRERVSGFSSNDSIGALRWWTGGGADEPLLLVTTPDGAGGQKQTFALSAATGRLVRVLSDVFDPQVADLDGDGIDELWYSVEPQGAARLLAIPGTPPQRWKRLGLWRAADDLDRDGFSDLVSVDRGPSVPNAARSGRDGSMLWPEGIKAAVPRPTKDAGAGIGDLNTDGVPDVLGGLNTHLELLVALSGLDGRQLWTAKSVDLGLKEGRTSRGTLAGYLEYPSFHPVNLDGDHATEVLAIMGDGWNVCVALLSGHTGRAKWTMALPDTAARYHAGDPGRPHWLRQPVIADLDSDGVQDLALWLGQTSDGGTFAELRAIGGRDGKPLWRVPPLRETADRKVMWSQPAVGDLDGDGAAEIILTMQSGFDAEVISLDGKSGEEEWVWRWRSDGSPDGLPPLLVNVGGRRQVVCLGIAEAKAERIVILNSLGELHASVPFQRNKIYTGFSEAQNWWRTLGTLGDGNDTVVYRDVDTLCAYRPADNAVLWKWPIPSAVWRNRLESASNRGTLVGAQRQDAIHPTTLVAWIGTTVYGIDGAVGRPLWRCEVDWSPEWSSFEHPVLELLASGEPRGWPRVLHRRSGQLSTIVHQAWPVSPDGKYQPPAPQPRTYQRLPELGTP